MSGMATVSGSADSVGGTSPMTPVSSGAAAVARRRSDRLVGTSRAVLRALEQVAVAGRGRFHLHISGGGSVEKDLVAPLLHEGRGWAAGGFFALAAPLGPEAPVGPELVGGQASPIHSLP